MISLSGFREALTAGGKVTPDQTLLKGVTSDGRATLRNTQLARDTLKPAPDVMDALAFRSGEEPILHVELAPGTTGERRREIEATAKAITAGRVTVKVQAPPIPALDTAKQDLAALPDVDYAGVLYPRFEGERFKPTVTIHVEPTGHLPDVKAQVQDWLSAFNSAHPELPNVKLSNIEYAKPRTRWL